MWGKSKGGSADEAHPSGDVALVPTASEPRSRPQKLRRTWPQRGVLLLGLALIAGCLYGSWYITDFESTFGDIPRIAMSNPNVLGDIGDPDVDPRNILVLGSTDTEGIAGDDQSLIFRGSENLTDTMMLLRIDPIAAQAAVLSIPRDLVVPIAGRSLNKINAAIAFGGPEIAVETVKKAFDIEIHDFVMVNFAGFRRLVDAIDGVPVYFPHEARDLGSFFDAPAGCYVLNGEQALNYVRSRKLEERIDGRWVNDNKNDYGRSERQRDFLVLAMERAVSKGGRNPVTMRNLLKMAVESKSLVLDEKLTAEDLVDIGRSFSSFNPEELQRYALPTTGHPTFFGGLQMLQGDAQPILDVFRGLSNTLQPNQVTMTVLDPRRENDPPGADALSDKGFRVTTKRTVDLPEQTVIRFTADMRNAAVLLARHLVDVPAFQQLPGSRATARTLADTLTLEIGTDYEGVRFAPRGDDEIGPISRAVDEAALGRVTVVETTTTTTSAAPRTGVSTTTGRGSPATTAAVTTTTPPPAPAFVPAPTVGGIIGRPPDGLTCGRL
jgi:LCP family protein required for cell wall assembly